MSAKAKLQLAGAMGIVGSLLRLVGLVSKSASLSVAGDLIGLTGFVVVLVLKTLPKIGDYRPWQGHE